MACLAIFIIAVNVSVLAERATRAAAIAIAINPIGPIDAFKAIKAIDAPLIIVTSVGNAINKGPRTSIIAPKAAPHFTSQPTNTWLSSTQALTFLTISSNASAKFSAFGTRACAMDWLKSSNLAIKEAVALRLASACSPYFCWTRFSTSVALAVLSISGINMARLIASPDKARPTNCAAFSSFIPLTAAKSDAASRPSSERFKSPVIATSLLIASLDASSP